MSDPCVTVGDMARLLAEAHMMQNVFWGAVVVTICWLFRENVIMRRMIQIYERSVPLDSVNAGIANSDDTAGKLRIVRDSDDEANSNKPP